MVLSERELRLLQEMESHLLAEDPRLASALRVSRLRVGLGAVLAVSGLAVGVLLMSAGVLQGETVGTAVALVGFVVLLASTSSAVELLRARAGRRRPVEHAAR